MVTPAMEAAIVSAVVDALKSAVEIHLSPINSRLKGMQSDISSNHGHVTKCLFSALEAKLITLDGALDSKTRELDAKGESHFAKITSLDGRIATNVGERIANLETKVEVATINFDAKIAALESQGLEEPSTGLPQPTITPRHGRSPVQNPYDALVAAPSNLSKYSDPEYFDNRVALPSNLSKYSDPEYFDNRAAARDKALANKANKQRCHESAKRATTLATKAEHNKSTTMLRSKLRCTPHTSLLALTSSRPKSEPWMTVLATGLHLVTRSLPRRTTKPQI
jgi:hypothetical protein